MSVENFRGESGEPRLNNRIRKLFESCGINPDDVNPNLLGRGGNHKVYRFRDGERVVKVPINQRIGTVGSASEEKDNIALYLQYFPNFSVPTSFLESPEGYCTIMDFVDGRLVTKDDIFESDSTKGGQLTPVGTQLEEIIRDNQTLINETGKMMDLVGLEGLVGAIGGLRPGGKAPQLTNVRISDGQLRIVDYDLVALRKLRGPLDKIKAVFAFQLNQQVLSYYFGLNYRGKS